MGVYKRGGIYYINYFLGGKRVRKATGTSQKKAVAELEATRVAIRSGVYREPRRDSFEELVDEYDLKQSPKKGYISEKYVIKRIRDYFVGAIVQDIGVREVEGFLIYLENLPVKGGGERSAADTNHHMVCLCSIFKKALLRDWITRNPADPERVERPDIGDGRDNYLQVMEAGRLLDACQPHLYGIVLAALDSGMRKSEILGLRWSEIKDGMVCLPKERTKTAKARKVPISEALGAELQRIKDAQIKASRGKVSTMPDLVFQPPRERRIRKEGKLHIVTGPLKDIRIAFDTAKVEAGIDPDIHFHDLRRTFRSHMKMTGVDSFTLNAIDGHENPKMEKTYTQLTDEHLKQAISHVPKWQEVAKSHKTATERAEKEKGLEGRNPPALVFTGAEGGI